MIRKICWTLIVASLIAVDAWAANSPDLVREQRMRTQIVDAILDGEVIDIATPSGQTFLGIFTENSADTASRGTVIILHGRGFHPDWADVVHPLRVGLAEHGWNTLSVQMPVLDKTAKYFDYVDIFPAAIPRIEASIDEARNRTPQKVVLLAHSCGAHMALHWANHRGPEVADRIDAFVGIGMGATDYGQPMIEPFALDKMTIPLLDLYATGDYPAVLRLAPQRLAELRRGGNPKNVQYAVPDAGHYFVDRGEALVEATAAWLKTL